jgi:predicted homoserine dehydrogenase-like protein
MIIVDTALEKRQREGNPIRVGMVGAGFMARGIALQLVGVTPGIRLVAIANRHIEGAKRAYEEAGVAPVCVVDSVGQLEGVVRRGECAVTEDADLLCEADGIDAIIETTGTIEFGAHVVLTAIERRKHVIMMNAELMSTLGPLLKTRADRAGVIFTNDDGDQPGVIMNLYRYVKGLGVKPLLCGNIKGLQDPYRNPTTQANFARQWKQKAPMVTSFADGTKISFEQAVVANATGMSVAKRGMFGPTVPVNTPIQEAVGWYPLQDLAAGPGIVDYVVGAAPSPGVFVLGTHDHPAQHHYLNYYKMGAGPYYCFYFPYHLCHLEISTTVARAVLFADPTVTPAATPRVEVVATAKTDLRAGQVLDGIGYYMTYGQCENSSVALAENLLPMGLAEGCKLLRDIHKDQVLTYDDVEVPANRLCDRLRREQDDWTRREIQPASAPTISPVGTVGGASVANHTAAGQR